MPERESFLLCQRRSGAQRGGSGKLCGNRPDRQAPDRADGLFWEPEHPGLPCPGRTVWGVLCLCGGEGSAGDGGGSGSRGGHADRLSADHPPMRSWLPVSPADDLQPAPNCRGKKPGVSPENRGHLQAHDTGETDDLSDAPGQAAGQPGV